MEVMKTFGWLLIAVGLTMISLPLISGFTGFFHTAYFSAVPRIEFELNIRIVIVGAVLMLAGLLLANPKKETFLNRF